MLAQTIAQFKLTRNRQKVKWTDWERLTAESAVNGELLGGRASGVMSLSAYQSINQSILSRFVSTYRRRPSQQPRNNQTTSVRRVVEVKKCTKSYMTSV